MESVYNRLEKRTRQIVSQFPPPAFFAECNDAHVRATSFFNSDPTIGALKKSAAGELNDDFGHGMTHATKVAIDAGAILIVEATAHNYSESTIDRLLLLVQTAGLLHDVSRMEKEHAQKGARKARRILSNFSFSNSEVDDICRAIQNHEAFKQTLASPTRAGALISDCLYDADKFRWGPDNFTDTVWAMIRHAKVPVERFFKGYHRGMTALEKIRITFRTTTGKKYGPDFIDTGLAIGNELYRVMKDEYQLG
ncbi:MAG: HD domain-containing protein [Deltaproteobacteria bacterium]|nr:HD domain-containing protein [Deltaproteobacteria bacterium]